MAILVSSLLTNVILLGAVGFVAWPLLFGEPPRPMTDLEERAAAGSSVETAGSTPGPSVKRAPERRAGRQIPVAELSRRILAALDAGERARLEEGKIVTRAVRREGRSVQRSFFLVPGSHAALFRLLTDYGRFVHLYDNLDECRVLRRFDGGALVKFKGQWGVFAAEYVLKRTYHRLEREIRFEKVAGPDRLKAMRGAWVFLPYPEEGWTLVMMDHQVEVDVAIPSKVVEHFAGKNFPAMVERIRRWIDGYEKKS